MPEKTDLMKLYEKKHPDKYAIWQGKITKQFKIWKKEFVKEEKKKIQSKEVHYIPVKNRLSKITGKGPLNPSYGSREAFSQNEKKTKSYTFEDIWKILAEIFETKKTINTLSKKKPNKIKLINKNGIEVETEKGINLVKKKIIKHAWKYLAKDGYLYQKDYKKSTYRSSFMLALFYQLPFVEIKEKRPISVKLVNDQTQKFVGEFQKEKTEKKEVSLRNSVNHLITKILKI